MNSRQFSARCTLVDLTESITLISFMQKSIVEELLHEDGLTIMANGLTWQKISAVLLRVQIERRRDPAQRGVLLVLGCRDWQRSTLKDELARLDPQLLPRSLPSILLVVKPSKAVTMSLFPSSGKHVLQMPMA